MNPIWLILLFIGSAIIGFFIIRNIPALLHTPLMSGMNALSGITVIGAIIGTLHANSSKTIIISGIACLFAIINIMGGFALTHKMLLMFSDKKDSEGKKDLSND